LADGPRRLGGRSVPLVFVPCSSCSCSPFVSIRHGFEFWLDEVSDGLRVLGGRSAGAWRTVRMLPADGPWFAVRHWWFSVLYRTVRGVGPDSPRCWCGRSAWPVRTVRPSWPDGPPEPVCFACWFDFFLLLSCFRVCFKESFLGLEVDP
jgi:hypothetical protein